MAGRTSQSVDPKLVTSTGKPIETTRNFRSAPVSNKQPVDLITAVKRPDHGTKGELIYLLVNWFRINFNRTLIYVYKVTITEEGKFKRPPTEITFPETKTRIFWKAVRNNWKRFPDPHRLVFDDKNYVCTPDHQKQGCRFACEHPDKEGVEVTVEFEYEDKFELNLRGEADAKNANFSSIFLKNLLSQNTRYSPADNASDREKDVSERFAHVNGGMFIIPRTPGQEILFKVADIQPGVDALMGVFASVRRMEDFAPVVLMGQITKLFLKPNLDLITFYRLIECESLSGLRKPLHDSDRLCMSSAQARNFNHKLEGVRLQCKHVPGKDKDDLVTGPVERHVRFVALKEDTCADREPLRVEDNRAPARLLKEIQVKDKRTGKYITKKLFKKWTDMTMDKWYAANGIKLKYPKLPLCIVKTGKRQELVPLELLFTHYKLQKFVKMMSFYARRTITQKLARTPVQHHKMTNDLVTKSLEYDKDPFMQAQDVSLNPQMVECEGRVVEPCAIQGMSRDGLKVETLQLNKESGQFAMSRGMETSKKQIRFAVCKLTDAIDKDCVKEFYIELVKRCVNRGFDVADPERPFYVKDEPMNREDSLQISRMIEDGKTKFHQQGNANDEILVFIFVTKLVDDLYGQIKYLCDIEHGLVSQVVDEESIRKTVSKQGETPSDVKSIYHHVCLKLNAKLGGVNHILAEPDEPEYGRMPSHQRTMFIGIDVIHPSPNSPIRDCSLAAIVASMDQNAARYAARIKVNSRCNESVQHFDEHFAFLMAKYHAESFKYDKNGYLPARIVILRDGVSDSEMIKAASEELESIKYAWNKTANGVACPPITYIIVQKNHKTRFYQRPEGEKGKVKNPPLGTVVDKDAVTPHMFDFYMVSHATLLGTTRPIHYTVVYDDCRSNADAIQEMIFRMCFLYARCSKPVSLPAPVYYAHLACERAAFHHQYAIKSGRLEEILDRGPNEDEQQYATRVDRIAHLTEPKLQVDPRHPGMYFI